MSDLGIALAWAAARATALAVFGVALYLWARRRGPSSASASALAGLVGLLGLAALGPSPWPRWWTPEARQLEVRPASSRPEPARHAEVVEEHQHAITPLPLRPSAIDHRPLTISPAALTAPLQTVAHASPSAGARPPGRWWERIVQALKSRNAASPREPSPGGARLLPSLFMQGSAGALPSREGDASEAPGPAASTLPTPTRSADPSIDAPPAWPWSLVAWVFAAGLGFGLVRLAAGLWAVERLRLGGVPVTRGPLAGLLEELAGSMKLRRRIALRVSPDLTTPATVGWLRPAILLPPDWEEWTEAERTAVLAHELAHVARGDYLSWLVAQVSLALHFYHPLAHWLAGRLRLQQELAADAAAAPHAGGRRAYLATLARMALRQDVRPAAWPARPFFPRLGTLLRRIEMLRSATDNRRAPLPLTTRVITYGMLVALGLALAGLRAPEGRAGNQKAAEVPKSAAKAKAVPQTADSAPLSLDFVPDDAALVVAARPAAIVKRPEIKALIDAVKGEAEVAQILGVVDPGSIEQVTAVVTRSGASLLVAGGGEIGEAALMGAGGLIVHTRSPRDWKTLAGAFLPGVTESRRAGQIYYVVPVEDSLTVGFFQPDEQTLVVAPVPTLFSFMKSARAEGQGVHHWAESWRAVATGEVAVAADVGSLLGPFLPMLSESEEFALIGGTVAPLWEETESLMVGLDLSEGLTIRLTASCGNEAGARRVERTIQAILTLGENASQRFFPLVRRQALGGDGESAALLTLVDLGEQLLTGAEAVREGNTVRMTLSSKVDLGSLVRLALMSR